MEIGSIYEINPALVKPEGAEAGRESGAAEIAGIAKYGRKYCRYTASGREAVTLALRSLEQNRPGLPKRCLLPAYMCDSVFFPFEQQGWELYFYHVNKELAAEEGELCRRMEQVRPGLLFVHPYYGVDTWKQMRSLFSEWRKQGVCIMEDVTQSYYLHTAGLGADYVVGSLRKWYPVPDGGFVVSDEKLWDGALEDAEDYAGVRLEIQIQKWEYLNGPGSREEKREQKSEYLKRNREMEEELDRCTGVRSMSGITARMLGGADEDGAKERRSANCRYLDEKLRGKKSFVPVLQFGDAPEQQAPLYFPVYAENREELQHFLGARGIFAPVLWLVGKENRDCLSEDETYIYEHLLALPMDQRYGKEEMQRIEEVLGEYERHSSVESGADRRQAEQGQENPDGERKRPKDDKKQLTGIRVDANETVATGHIMRCITIAEQLKQKGSRVLFFTADEYAAGWLERAGMEYVCLHTEWNHMAEEIPQLRRELKKAGCGKLLVDSYQTDREYFDKLGDLCKLIYMDDCFEDIYPVNLLINYNAYHVRFPYKESYEGKTKLLLGTSYVPLREEFGKQGRTAGNENEAEENRELRHVLLSSGGGDGYNALGGILEEAVKDGGFGQVVFHVAVGKFNRYTEQLERLADSCSNIRLHREVSHMAELMGMCVAAVSAAGTMLFELSAMQIPAVFFVSADNQRYDSEFFAAEDRMLFAGDIRKDREGCIGNICANLKRLLEDGSLRQRMKTALCQVTDGRGAQRIAEEILLLS